ncbi:Ger(x)C family spore germination protein [Peribacillus sp. SI8-4]|uniref:Ger(x)C family spore germination protein n=1 Tax=Peribacillus sp. SI8-4 TaxID=3048009 RepID=UPI0025578ED7|nr:Ger(x)C family spore germination protein [Peribacillus sp. SI8-4]
MKYLYFIFIILSVASIFFSQEDKHELNQSSFSFALGIDYEKEGYTVSLQLINPGEISGEKLLNNSPYIVYKAKGKTIDTALEKISMNTSRHLDLKQEQIIVLGEELARKGRLKEIVEYILHSPDIPANALIITTKGNKASELLKIFSPVEGYSALEITNTLNKLGRHVLNNASEIKVELLEDGKDISLPYIELKGDLQKGMNRDNLDTTTPAHIVFGGFGLFKDGTLKKFLDYRDSLFLQLLNGKSSGFIIESTCPAGSEKFAFKLFNGAVKKKEFKLAHDNYSFQYILNLSGDIRQYNCHGNLKDPETISQLETQINKTIQSKENKILSIAQDHELDPFGLGHSIKSKDPKAWRNVEKDWSTRIKNARLNVHSDITIQNVGNYKSRGD